ncbi:LPXTG cell wall anchor domain-containing protein [Frondihabitans peucedani]|uniref:LPXTG-motif cell wall-anchored protein n=1 Tax=Frondihabitans peucedani TaxID=598626 RepID=A0ABP8E4D3_9MICO
MTTHSWRKALAVPAVVSLAFGGALLAAGPALAAPAEPAATTQVEVPAPTDTTAPATTAPAAPVSTTAPTPSATVAAAPVPAATTAAPTAPTTTAPATTPPATTAPATPTPTPTDTSTATASAFAVTTPVDGEPSATTTPTFAGTGLPGSTVIVQYLGADGDLHDAGTATVDTDGTWTLDTSFADLGPGITKAVLTVAELDASGDPVTGVEPVIREISFLSPPVQAQGRSIVLTPDYPTADEATTAGIGLATTGFAADEPLVVTVTGPDGKAVAYESTVATPTADADGAFSELLGLPAGSKGGTYRVTVTGTVSKLQLSKTAYVLGDPTITSPTAGEKIVGTSVTFTGTGTPGSSIGLVIAPTSAFAQAEAEAAAADGDSSTGSGTTAAKAPAASPRAAGTPSASSDPQNEDITVGASGTWSVTVELAQPGDYTAVAIAGVLDADGNPISDNTGLPVLSGPSATVEFVLAAAPVITTSATGPTLAYTGSDAEPYVVAGGLAVLLGIGLMVATRRRRDGLIGAAE